MTVNLKISISALRVHCACNILPGEECLPHAGYSIAVTGGKPSVSGPGAAQGLLSVSSPRVS